MKKFFTIVPLQEKETLTSIIISLSKMNGLQWKKKQLFQLCRL